MRHSDCGNVGRCVILGSYLSQCNIPVGLRALAKPASPRAFPFLLPSWSYSRGDQTKPVKKEEKIWLNKSPCFCCCCNLIALWVINWGLWGASWLQREAALKFRSSLFKGLRPSNARSVGRRSQAAKLLIVRKRHEGVNFGIAERGGTHKWGFPFCYIGKSYSFTRFFL